jgi:hypothetical protein
MRLRASERKRRGIISRNGNDPGAIRVHSNIDFLVFQEYARSSNAVIIIRAEPTKLSIFTNQGQPALLLVTVEPRSSSALKAALKKIAQMVCMQAPPFDLQMLEEQFN